MVLGQYRQTVYGMYGTNPENAGTITILACLLGTVSLGDRSGVPISLMIFSFSGHAIASLWVVDWPTRGLAKDAVKNVMDYVTLHLKIVDMLLAR